VVHFFGHRNSQNNGGAALHIALNLKKNVTQL